MRLTNPIQEYAWGSQTAIYLTFGWPTTGRPAAELWLGAHDSAPSMVAAARTEAQPSYLLDQPVTGRALGELIGREPQTMLGSVVADEYGPRLPYLLKVLSANRALSLQVHPRAHVARAGYARENARGVAPGSPHRNYRDPSHKPEMLVALTDFEGLCGFRRPRRILELLEGLAGDTVARMRQTLTADPNAKGIERALGQALALRETDCGRDLAATVSSIRDAVAAARTQGTRISRGHLAAITLSEQYPGDPGALVSLMLNRVSLKPGEGVYLGAGQIHAYLSGLGVEIMASSDNVLRAGLTPKRVDIPELMAITDFAPAAATRPTLRAAPGGLTQYRSPAAEFALLIGEITVPTPVVQSGPRIVLCLSGTLTLTTDLGERLDLAPGQSVFCPHGVGALQLAGTGSVVVAYVP